MVNWLVLLRALMADALIRVPYCADESVDPRQRGPGWICSESGANPGSGDGAASARREPLRDQDPTAPRRKLLCVSRRVGDVRLARGLARGAASRRRDRTRDRAWRSGEEHTAESGAARGGFSADAARARQAGRGRHRRDRRMDSRGRRLALDRRRGTFAGSFARARDHARAAGLLGVPADSTTGRARREGCRLDAHRYRSLHPRAART